MLSKRELLGPAKIVGLRGRGRRSVAEEALTPAMVGPAGEANLPAIVDTLLASSTDPIYTHFYLGDHLGTAQMEFSSGGWPVWQGQFAPYGPELDSQTTQNHYKFTGKERDAESGLDYFGARYYASNMGRMMSPDWSAKAQPVPYAKLDDPQSVNLYSYVRNNPLSRTDPDGHYDCNENECKMVKSALKDINKASNSKKLTADQRADLKGVVSFYGKAGDHNGVTVNTGNAAVGANGGTHTDADGKTTKFGTQINNLVKAASANNMRAVYAYSEGTSQQILNIAQKAGAQLVKLH